ncbi:MAG: glycosyltransferase [Candidatus Woesearchaeota archaeon]
MRPKQVPKTAVIHNYLDNMGGAEHVTYSIAKALDSDIYTCTYKPGNARKQGFATGKIYPLGPIPYHAPFKQQAALLRSRLYSPKKKYDVHIISGDWAIGAAKRARPTLWYAHSPAREIWDLYRYTRTQNMSGITRWIFDIWVMFNRGLQRRYAQKITRIVCNSENVRQRIRKYIGREARVIHPPVDTSSFYYKPQENFWLSVNRFVRHKRLELQLDAFRKMPEKRLVIVAGYEKSHHFLKYKKEIETKKPPNVTIMHHVNNETLRELYATCTGFLTTSKEEDFGLTAVEAMSAGKPVIAPNEGGYKETVIDGKTGILINNITTKKIRKAISIIEQDPGRYREACKKKAEEFDTRVFIKKIREEVESLAENK